MNKEKSELIKFALCGSQTASQSEIYRMAKCQQEQRMEFLPTRIVPAVEEQKNDKSINVDCNLGFVSNMKYKGDYSVDFFCAHM